MFQRMILGFLLISGYSLLAQNEPDTSKLVNTKETEYRYYFAEGLRFKMLGDLKGAKGHFEHCLLLAPDSSGPAYELASLSYIDKDFKTASYYARKAWTKKEDNQWYGQMLGESLVQLGNYKEAAEVYEKVSAFHPEEKAYFLVYVDLLIQAKEWKKVLKVVKEKSKEEEFYRWGVLKESDIYTLQGDVDKAQKNIEKLLKLTPDDIEARGILAESYTGSGKMELAEEHYKKLRNLEPENPAVRFSYAQFLYNVGRKEEALVEYNEPFKSGDVNPMIKIQIVLEYLNAQTQQDSLEQDVVKLVETLYQYEKGNPDVDAIYGNYLYNTERNAEAEEVYDRIIINNPNNFTVWQNQLFILNILEKFEKMKSIATQALEVFPNQPLFYLFRGIAEISLDENEDAIKSLKEGLNYPSGNPELTKQIYISLGDALYKTGEIDQAFGYFEDLLALDPENVLVLNNYSYYLSLRGEKLDKALDMIKKCLAIENDNATYLDTYAWVLYKQENFAQALEVIRKVIDLDDEPSAEVMEHYGDILGKNGKLDEAIEIWKSVMIMEPGRKGVAEKIKQAEK